MSGCSLAGFRAFWAVRRRCMLFFESCTYGKRALRRRISHDWLDIDRKLATHVISLQVSILFHLAEERCLCLFSKASAVTMHRARCAPSPHACRQPWCSKPCLMARCDQIEVGRTRREMRHLGDKSVSSGWRRGDSRGEAGSTTQPFAGCGRPRTWLEPLRPGRSSSAAGSITTLIH